jgi:hypothetical protein
LDLQSHPKKHPLGSLESVVYFQDESRVAYRHSLFVEVIFAFLKFSTIIYQVDNVEFAGLVILIAFTSVIDIRSGEVIKECRVMAAFSLKPLRYANTLSGLEYRCCTA